MTGMVVSVDGTVITLVEMDSLEDMDFSSQRPAGSFVTITLDKKGNATYVLVSASSGFGAFGSRG